MAGDKAFTFKISGHQETKHLAKASQEHFKRNFSGWTPQISIQEASTKSTMSYLIPPIFLPLQIEHVPLKKPPDASPKLAGAIGHQMGDEHECELFVAFKQLIIDQLGFLIIHNFTNKNWKQHQGEKNFLDLSDSKSLREVQIDFLLFSDKGLCCIVESKSSIDKEKVIKQLTRQVKYMKCLLERLGSDVNLKISVLGPFNQNCSESLILREINSTAKIIPQAKDVVNWVCSENEKFRCH